MHAAGDKYIEDLLIRYPALQGIQEEIIHAYQVLEQGFAGGGKLLIAGNGGSAADAEHIVGELMKGFNQKRRLSTAMSQRLALVDAVRGRRLAAGLQGGLPAIALHVHTAFSTAFHNDEDSELVFAQQVYGYGQAGDVLLAISTSGNSANVLQACVVARALGMQVIGLTGRDGGELVHLSDAAVIVPEHRTHVIQEYHLPIYHTWCLMLEEHFFG